MKFVLSIFLSIIFLTSNAQSDTVTVMYYNILNFNAASSSDTTKNQHFKNIFHYVKPDVLVVLEMSFDSDATYMLNNLINSNGINYYSKAVYIDGPDKDNIMFYNNQKFGMARQDTIGTMLRNINRFKLYWKSISTDTIFFDFYGAHLKASSGLDNETKRYLEVKNFISFIETKTNGKNIFFGGDFNLYTSNEPAYKVLLDSGIYKLKDPLNRPGSWDNSVAFADIHTQSTRTTAFGGGATGGMDSRFDFTLVTGDVMTGLNNITYIPNSYMALGNDGNRFDSSLIKLPWSTTVPSYITNSLYYMSDHLPVVSKYKVTSAFASTITAAGPTIFCQGGSVLLNATTGVGFTYQWKLNNTNIPGATSSSYIASLAGSYTVAITNSQMVTLTSQAVTVTVNPIPVVTLSSFTPICISSGTINLSGGSPSGGTFSGTGVNLGFFSPSISGPGNIQITYTYTDTQNCSNSVTIILVVDSVPFANAGIDKTIQNGGAGIQIGANSIPGYSYLWSPASGLSNVLISNPIANPSFTTVYGLQVSNGTCIKLDTVVVEVKYSVRGKLVYDNSLYTPLSNVKVLLEKNGSTIDSVQTDITGNYLFTNLETGPYSIRESINKTWGGGNSTDALLAQRHFVGLSPLTGLRLIAADVNNNGAVNSADALFIRKRFAGTISSYPAKDWYFSTEIIMNESGDNIINMFGICAGDVNGSYIPSNSKKSTSIVLMEGGNQSYSVGDIVKIPVIILNEAKISAISLVFNYDSAYMDVLKVNSKAALIAPAEINFLKSDKIFFSWNSIEPLNLLAYDTILIIEARLKKLAFNTTNQLFALDPKSEIADSLAHVIENIVLQIPKLEPLTSNKSQDLSETIIEIYPNPVLINSELLIQNANNEIESIDIYEITAKKLKYFEKGVTDNPVVIKIEGISPGIYLIKFTLTNGQIVSRKLMVKGE